MEAVILAGGLGTRISEETHLKPKPMIGIGGKPILWHIMKSYSAQGIRDFIICLVYKGYLIKEYFANYFLHMSDVTFDMSDNSMKVHQNTVEPWKVTLVDTGEKTMTGGRLKRVRDYICDENFCFTYGDGLSDVNIKELIDFHHSKKTLATLTATQPPGRFGALDREQHRITSFQEKPQGDGSWINGGYFVLSPQVFDYIEDDKTNGKWNLYRHWRMKGSFPLLDMMVFGNRWIHFEIRLIWRSCGQAARPRGKFGSEVFRRSVPRPQGVSDWSYRF